MIPVFASCCEVPAGAAFISFWMHGKFDTLQISILNISHENLSQVLMNKILKTLHTPPCPL